MRSFTGSAANRSRILVIFLSVPAAAFAATASALVLRNATAPRWLGFVGLGFSVFMLASAFIAPLIVFGLWLIVTRAALAATRPTAPVRQLRKVALEV